MAWIVLLFLAADLDSLQSSLVIESQRSTIGLMQWGFVGMGGAFVATVAALFKTLTDSRKETLAEVKAAAEARERQHAANLEILTRMSHQIEELTDAVKELPHK
jgi:hypothetical protein